MNSQGLDGYGPRCTWDRLVDVSKLGQRAVSTLYNFMMREDGGGGEQKNNNTVTERIKERVLGQ